jgi:hypothetical protein
MSRYELLLLHSHRAPRSRVHDTSLTHHRAAVAPHSHLHDTSLTHHRTPVAPSLYTSLVWYWDGDRSCMWGGGNSTCIPGAGNSSGITGQRSAFQPIKEMYSCVNTHASSVITSSFNGIVYSCVASHTCSVRPHPLNLTVISLTTSIRPRPCDHHPIGHVHATTHHASTTPLTTPLL